MHRYPIQRQDAYAQHCDDRSAAAQHMRAQNRVVLSSSDPACQYAHAALLLQSGPHVPAPLARIKLAARAGDLT